MTDREAIRDEIALLLAALAKARDDGDQVAAELFTRDIDNALRRLGW